MCWAWGLFFSVVYIPSESPSEKTSFLFASGCRQLLIRDRGLGLRPHLSAGAPSGLALRRLHACCLWRLSCCVEDSFLGAFHPHRLFQSLPRSSLSLERSSSMETSQLALSVPKSLRICTLCSCGLCVLINCKKQLR